MDNDDRAAVAVGRKHVICPHQNRVRSAVHRIVIFDEHDDELHTAGIEERIVIVVVSGAIAAAVGGRLRGLATAKIRGETGCKGGAPSWLPTSIP